MKVEASIPALTMSTHEEDLPSHDLGDIDAALDNPDLTPTSHPVINFYHKHTFIIIAVSALIIGAAAVRLGGAYWSAKTIALPSSTAAINTSVKPVAGFNMTIPAADFQSKLKSIMDQPVTLSVGQYSEKLDSNLVKGWLQISASKDRSEYYIHVNEAAMANSLAKEAGTYARAPVNQVTVNEDGKSVVAVAGQDGRALSDPGGLKSQAHDTAKNVLAGKGLQFNTPLKTQPFHAVTPAAFDKLLVANTTTKKLWAYQNGKLIKTWLTSDGAPDTPTPLGEFHVYAKYSVQDMYGYGPGHVYYFQPHVRWISYFYEGSAVHGVYWHPMSWFGNINSSHGCVGLPEDQAEWIYNWDDIGTTVIVNA